MNKKVSLGVTIALVTIAIAITFSITMSVSMGIFNNKVYGIREREKNYTKIAEIDAAVRQNYAGTIDEDLLMDGVAQGYLLGIGDTDGTYYSAAQYSELLAELNGTSVGIGVQVEQEQVSYLKVTSVDEKSPAAEAGIQVGNIIVAIDDTQLNTISYEESVKLLSGSAGSTVVITIRGETEDVKYSITRRQIEKQTVFTEILDGDGYIRITEFDDVTIPQFEAALKDLTEKGVTGLIFDLRQCTKGSIYATTEVLDQLLPAGNIATAVDHNDKIIFNATSGPSEVTLPMTVLVNRNTASGGELFAQVLKEFGKAKVVGAQTQGKGTMQQIVELEDGSALSLTVGYFRTALGNSIDGVGVTPDFEVKLSTDQSKLYQAGTLALTDDPLVSKAKEVLGTQKNSTNVVDPATSQVIQATNSDQTSEQNESSQDEETSSSSTESQESQE